MTAMCLCFLVRRSSATQEQVLLGRKKRGLGAGNIVGLGGKVEPHEDPRSATAREVAEESGVTVDPGDLDQRAVISFRFPTKPSWDQRATVFVAEQWIGEPMESDEIAPLWYDVPEIPFDEMWADARHWLPQVLSGGQVTAQFAFRPDLRTLASSDVRVDDPNPGHQSRRPG